jgi:hypothetical protein
LTLLLVLRYLGILLLSKPKSRRLSGLSALVGILLHISARSATLLTFDDFLPTPGYGENPDFCTYGGLFWENFRMSYPYPPPGGPGTVSYPSAARAGTYGNSAICCTTSFDLNSGYLTRDVSNNSSSNSVRIQGLLGPTVLYDNTYSITDTPTLVSFNYLGINKVKFFGAVLMDNLSVTINCAAPDCGNYVVRWGCFNWNPCFPGFLTNIIALSVADLYLTQDGTVLDLNGPVPGATNIIAIASGDLLDPNYNVVTGYHSLALKADGKILGLGSNTNGQIDVPIDLTNVIAIAAGSYHSLALKADGTVVGFGAGDGAIVPGGLSNIVSIAAGLSNSLALRSDGRVFAWGTRNASGIDTLSNIVAIAAGRGIAWKALRSDGRSITGHAFGQAAGPSGSNTLAISLSRNESSDNEVYMDLLIDGTVVADGFLLCCPYNLIDPGLTNVQDIAATGFYQDAHVIIGHGPPPLGPPILNATKDYTGFNVTVSTRSGRVYRLEYTDSLNNPSWTGFPLAAGTGTPQTFTDPSSTVAQRFYRVRHWWHN